MATTCSSKDNDQIGDVDCQRLAPGTFAGTSFAAAATSGAAALIRDADESEISHGYLVAKRSLDIGGAVVALVLLSPLILFAAIAVKRDSVGPAFFRQRRVGRDGELFWMIKLRTMIFDQDEAVFKQHIEELRKAGAADDQYTIKIDEDPRITRVGDRLRRWSVDELPNFVNVLKGSMTLVGPRPLVIEEAELIGLEHPRFSVKPGVTGWAQINGFRGETDTLEKMEKRIEYDLWYIRNHTIWLDLKIILLTLFRGFVNKNAW